MRLTSVANCSPVQCLFGSKPAKPPLDSDFGTPITAYSGIGDTVHLLSDTFAGPGKTGRNPANDADDPIPGALIAHTNDWGDRPLLNYSPHILRILGLPVGTRNANGEPI